MLNKSNWSYKLTLPIKIKKHSVYRMLYNEPFGENNEKTRIKYGRCKYNRFNRLWHGF